MYARDTQLLSDAQEQQMKAIRFDDHLGSHGTAMVLAEAAASRSGNAETGAGNFVCCNKIESGLR